MISLCAWCTIVNMDFFDQRYYSFTKNFLSVIGRWPFSHSKSWDKTFNTIYTIAFIAQVMPKVFCLILHYDDAKMVLDLLAPFSTDTTSLLKYTNIVRKKQLIVTLLQKMKKDWESLLNEEEKKILMEYAETGRTLVIGYTVAMFSAAFLFVIEPVVPKLQSIVFHTNLSDEDNYKYAVPMEFVIIDQEKYYWPLVTFSGISILIIIAGLVSSDLLFIILLEHVCGLFAVLGHRLEHFETPETNPQNVQHYPPMENKSPDMQHVTKCIILHNEAISYAEILEEIFIWCFGMMVLTNLPTLSVSAVQLMTPGNSSQENTKYGSFVLAQMLHLFFDFYLSEQLMYQSGSISDRITHGKWYDRSQEVQKLLLFMIMRSQRICYLTAGKIVVLSIENYGKFIKTAVSYFTVILSTQ